MRESPSFLFCLLSSLDEQCRVEHSTGYQGTGHHQPGGAAAARDAVKKEARRKAGIGYHEVAAGHTTPVELRRLVEKLVPGGGRERICSENRDS